MNDLTFDQIAAIDDRNITPVDVPEWGGRVYVRALSPAEAVAYFDACKKPDADEYDGELLRGELVARACCTKDGARLFPTLAATPLTNWRAVGRVYKAAQKANGLGDEEEAEKKESPAVPAAGSPTASPSPSASGT